MVISNLLISKTNRQNDISNIILKLCKNSLSPILVQTFNLCINKGRMNLHSRLKMRSSSAHL